MSALIGSISGLSTQASLLRSLTGSLGITGTETKGLATSLSAAMGSVSNFAKQNSFVRSIAASLSSGSGLGEQLSLLRSLSASLTTNSQFTKGSIENLRSHLGTPTVLTGHYDCHETLIANCGTVSASFAYLVVAIGAALFGVYAFRLSQRSSTVPEELKPEKVVVDKEGWETKDSANKKRKGKKLSGDDKDQEQKSED